MKPVSLLFTGILLFIACRQSPRPVIAGKIDGNTISIAEIDKFIAYQLFDLRQRVYILRTTALEEYLKEQVLQTKQYKGEAENLFPIYRPNKYHLVFHRQVLHFFHNAF